MFTINGAPRQNRGGAEPLTVAVIALLAASIGASAKAQTLSEVQRLAEQANFDRANAMLDQIQSGTGLGYEDLPEFFELRALVAFATQDEEKLMHALERLRALSPMHSFSVSVPPTLVERFTAIEVPAAKFSLEISAEETDTGVVLKVDKQDPLGLARATIVRTAGSSTAWMPYDGKPIALATFRYFAVLEGPGGAQLATVGSARAPEIFVADAQPAAPTRTDPLEPAAQEDEDDAVVWPWILGGILVVATGAIVAGFALSEENTIPVVSQPMFEN